MAARAALAPKSIFRWPSWGRTTTSWPRGALYVKRSLIQPSTPEVRGFGAKPTHANCAREVGARLVELVDGPLALDLDTPADLLLVEEVVPEAVDAL